MHAQVSEIDFSYFKRKVKLSYKIDLDAYKRLQMERRIRANMAKYNAESFIHYYAMMQKNPAIRDEFLDRITINVSELFRNPEQFRVLQDKVVPELLNNKYSLRIWSAGCSYGAEPYTLAIILAEAMATVNTTIYASDLDGRMIARANQGEFQAHELKCVNASRLDKYFNKINGGYKAKSYLTKMIEFQKHDLLNDTYRKGFDLILCRNVVIYFTDEARNRMYKKFFESLNPGGFLFVGGTERISNHQEIGFETSYPFFYRKPIIN